MANNNLQIVIDDIYSVENDFNAALSDKSISFTSEAEFATQALSENDYLLKIALQNRGSLISAVKNISAIGISLNPAKKQAYLVPRKNNVCLEISYMGLIDLALQSGSIKWAQADVVYSSEIFEITSVDKPPFHKRIPFAMDKGEIVGAYVIAKTIENDYLTDTMTIAEINGIKNRSELAKSGKYSPWQTDFNEMAKKTVVKRAYKYWPKNYRMDKAIHYLNTENEEGISIDNKTFHIINGDESNPQQKFLVSRCEEEAKKGPNFFEDFWINSLTQQERKIVGVAEKDRIKNEFFLISSEYSEGYTNDNPF